MQNHPSVQTVSVTTTDKYSDVTFAYKSKATLDRDQNLVDANSQFFRTGTIGSDEDENKAKNLETVKLED